MTTNIKSFLIKLLDETPKKYALKFNDYSLVQEVKYITHEKRNGGERASRKYLECHNKEIWENGKNQLHRKKAFLEEKPLFLGTTLILTGISVNPNNRLKIGTTGDISIVGRVQIPPCTF